MVIRKEHALCLLDILNREEKREEFSFGPEDELLLRELEVSRLVRLETPVKPVLTYGGLVVSKIIRELVDRKRIPHPEEWDDDFRWVGSEIIAMLDSAYISGRVGRITEKYLMERGFAERVRDEKSKKEVVVLTEEGKRILEIYKEGETILEIDAELSKFIREAPVGPSESSFLPTGTHEEHLLEAMKLIAYSIPESEIYTFTGLGQAVKKVLEFGGFVNEGDVITPSILWSLADYADGKEISKSALTLLMTLAFVGSDGELLPAGEWALEVLRLWKEGAREDIWSFNIEEEEVKVLFTIKDLIDKEKVNPEDKPTFKNIRREMIDKKVKEYKKLIDRYGRRIKEMPKKYQEIAEKFIEAKDLSRWYDDNFNLRETLYELEAFNLIESSYDDKGKEVFKITNYGERVLLEQEKNTRRISSTAVKSITMTRKAFSAPNIEWFKEAKEENLIGTGGPSKSGYLYASLAEEIERKPYLTRFELELFHKIPERGITIDDLLNELRDEEERRKTLLALEKLEARHLIDVLPDGNIVETEAGRKMDQALSSVPKGFGNPVNPLIYRLIKALVEVGTLYTKERKVRVLPKNLKEALRRSGLSEEMFYDAIKAARAAGFIGQNSVNNAGLLLLEAVGEMNPKERLGGYTEVL